jgi:hypothetical protein
MVRLTDAQLQEVLQAARMVPVDLRQTYLERLAIELRGREVGDGLIYRLAHDIARRISWDAERMVAVE